MHSSVKGDIDHSYYTAVSISGLWHLKLILTLTLQNTAEYVFVIHKLVLLCRSESILQTFHHHSGALQCQFGFLPVDISTWKNSHIDIDMLIL